MENRKEFQRQQEPHDRLVKEIGLWPSPYRSHPRYDSVECCLKLNLNELGLLLDMALHGLDINDRHERRIIKKLQDLIDESYPYEVENILPLLKEVKNYGK